MKRYLILDYETRSEAPLRSRAKKLGVGAFEYAVHPSTRVLCVSWKIGTRIELRNGIAPTRTWQPDRDSFYRSAARLFLNYLIDPDVVLVAHNAGFEQVITKHVLAKHIPEEYTFEPLSNTVADVLSDIPVDRWLCTASLAAAHALPRNLEGACQVLKLKFQKNPRGKLLIQRHCVPRKPTKNNPSIWNDDFEGLDELARYCADDVNAETELFLTLPPLIPSERQMWLLNQRLNLRGVYVDRPLVKSALKMIAAESKELTERALEISGGIAPSRRAETLKVLNRLGCHLPNLKAKTVSDAIASNLATGTARELLEIRQSISKTSTAKYQAFWVRSQSDGRLRDLQMWHGASTGRDAGTGVQPHNFPRGSISDVDEAITTVKEGNRNWLRAIHGNVMAALSSCLRGCIQATPGYTLYCADFNAIEARVLFWMADHAAGLTLFTSGVDPYRIMATKIYRKLLADVTDAEREVGKRAILGCGFGMGHKKFGDTCKQFGMPVTSELAELAVNVYRTEHALVPSLWSNLERAAIAATRHPGKYFKINHTKWFVQGKFLYCELPSGRRLAYFGPSVRIEEKWGRERATLYHWGMEHHQWVNRGTYGGKLTENVVQAVARDLMVTGQARTEEAGYIPMISVHDELVAERKRGGSLSEFESLMAETPDWAKGLPVKVKGWSGERYRK